MSETTYVFGDGMSSKLPGEHIENLLTHPAAFGERSKREVVRIHFPQT